VLAALLAEARERPDDDTPRLVLADWLQDQPSEVDRARGEFVRTQCEIVRIASQDPWCAEQMNHVWPLHGRASEFILFNELHRLGAEVPLLARLLSRQEELQRRYEDVWLGVLRPHLRVHRFWRGLPQVQMNGAEFRSARLDPLAVSEEACWLQALQLRNLDIQRADPVFGCPLLGHLHELNVSSLFLGWERQLARLTDSPHLGELTALDLSGASLGTPGVRAVACAKGLPRLTRLNLSNNGLSPRCAGLLARSEKLAGLTWLNLSYNRLADAGASQISDSPHLAGLKVLNLGDTALGRQGLADLTRPGSLPRLRMLGLAGNALDPALLELLLRWPGLDRLTALDLSRNPLGDTGVAALADSPRIANLTALELGDCGIGSEGAEALADSPHLAGLRALNLQQNPIGVSGARALADSPHLASLALLQVNPGDVSAAGLALLRERFGARAIL
jgi:uncharacterized protein (TIGR02996 family)